MTAIKIELAWLARKNSNNTALAESLVSLTGVIDNTIDTIQKINSRLRPKLLDELGLFPAMDRFVREFQSKTGVRCQFTYPENGISINKIQASSLYRIFQEAMTNISKHSKATSIIINIFADNESNLVLNIKDNGIGLQKNWNERPNSLGILGMNERAEMSGGEFYIKSELNNGTEVTAVIPIGNNKKNQTND
jgi:two-component system sensor histidine kinase UhpB